MTRWIQSVSAVVALCAGASANDPVNVSGASHVALAGYDPVAFFTDAKAVNGSPSIHSEHLGATYYFANEEHQKLFVAKPDEYAPQFGGYCAFGVAVGHLLPVDVSTWQVRDGKLYLNLNPEVLKGFNADFDANVAKARQNWPELVKSAASATPSCSCETALVNTSGASKVALDGFDPVAFFTDAKAVNGAPSIKAEHSGATYLFASEEHKRLFEAKPDAYLPQFGGFCAFGVGHDAVAPVDIRTWQVRDGKLYLNVNAEVQKLFNADFEANVAKARKNWPGLVKKFGS